MRLFATIRFLSTVQILSWLLTLGGVHTLDPSQCIAPLGMESLVIRDEDITASSSHDHGNVGPHHGRIRQELNGGAWCPTYPATPELTEWLQIELRHVHMITASETQGRFGNGNGVEFAEAYVLEYWRPRLNKWTRYKGANADSDQIRANINTYLPVKVALEPAILASRVRFLPYSHVSRTVCMRVELYGCRWTDAIVSYSMPQGDKRGALWEFYDVTYDGQWDGVRLRHGLGQLTDGRYGVDDFRRAAGVSTHGWVGWRMPEGAASVSPFIDIVFEFEGVREFGAAHIYAANQFGRDVEVFREVHVAFSVGGRHFDRSEPITYTTLPDHVLEGARNVTVKLHHRIGRFVRFRLFFAARWMLISEVTFESTAIEGNFTVERDPLEDSNSADENTSKSDSVLSVTLPGEGPPAPTTTHFVDHSYMGVIVGVLCILVLLMLSVVAFIVVQQRRFKGPASTVSSSPPPSHSADKTALYVGVGGGSGSDPEYAVPLQLSSANSPFHQSGGRISNSCTASPAPLLHDFLLIKPPPPPPPEITSFYAATEICRPNSGGAGFIAPPPPPPLSTPPPMRLMARQQQQQPRYAMTNSRAYIGP